MKFSLNKTAFEKNLDITNRFTSRKLSSLPTLQGVYLKTDGERLHFYATNLASYIHTSLPLKMEKKFELVVDPKNLIEFLRFLNPGEIELEAKENQLLIQQKKTKGSFSVFAAREDFPLPPVIKEKKQTLPVKFLKKYLPLVLFSSSSDESRPQLTGINFVSDDDELMMVSTDGFRLSLIKTKKQVDIPSMLIPAEFLEELLRLISDEKEVEFAHSSTEKASVFSCGDIEVYTRLIDGDFPPFEKVVAIEPVTYAIMDREELLRNTRLISVFARELSHVVLFDFQKGSLSIKPKKEGNDDDDATQDIRLEGPPQQIAFNYRFLLDFLSQIDGKSLRIEIARPDAPVIFKMEGNDEFLHVIMPVRV